MERQGMDAGVRPRRLSDTAQAILAILALALMLLGQHIT